MVVLRFHSSRILTIGFLTCITFGNGLAEELPKVSDTITPPADNTVIVRTVARDVQKLHISKAKIDDVIARRAFDQFLKAIDPMKDYFLKSDYEEFLKSRDQIDDMVLKGDLKFAYTVYKRFLKRLEEIMPAIHEAIDQPHDFSIDEKISVDRDTIQYATDTSELKDRWRKRVKLDLLASRANRVRAIAKGDKPDDESAGSFARQPIPKTEEEAREMLHRRYRSIARNSAQMDVYELLEIFLTAVTSSMDPHTTYMAPRARDNFNMQMSLKLEGIGAQLSPRDGLTTVASIVPGGAADKDGRLKMGDQIIAVAQEGDTKGVDVVDMKLDDVVSMIRGPANTRVYLTIKPKLGGENKLIDITRAKIQLEDQAARGELMERGQKTNGQPFKVGYINLPSFYVDMDAAQRRVPNYRSTTRDIAAILKGFKEQKADAVVLDLSDNGGGSLTEAINLTGLFIDSGPVVQVKQGGEVTPYDDENSGVAWGGPLVVMTTKKSASASEILAGAIKDYGRGLIVGDPTTHGKGTVQTLEDIGNAFFGASSSKSLGALKVTIQQFYLPDGKSTQREGVAADVILPSFWANMDIGESDMEYALPMDHVKALKHMDYHMVNSALAVGLQQKSTNRIQKSSDYDKLLKRIEAYRRQKDEKSISLKESEYLARRAELSAEDEEEKQILDSQTAKQKAFNPSFQNEEVLSITKDYTEALQSMDLARAG